MTIGDYIKVQKKEGGFVTGPAFPICLNEHDNNFITRIYHSLSTDSGWRRDFDNTRFKLGTKDKFLLI